ncbi:hypothetical protein [Telmatospirillum sp.]|uniref:hypothetical protein n=1 Tax=Telmatospirillum sp. TaxID=2079197 RepID=UPI002844AF67|nr:hypothetical protein [Telmatospirillum sp.]MDR3437890.1 hypothetical protein [Telmatospirillum sp.]
MGSVSGVGWLSGFLAALGTGILFWGDRIWGWGLLTASCVVLGGVIGLGSAMVVTGFIFFFWGDAAWGWKLIVVGAFIVGVREISARNPQFLSYFMSKLNRTPLTRVAIYADVQICFSDIHGEKTWHDITVTAAEPCGPRDMILTGFRQDNHEEQSFRLRLVKNMIDLETKKIVTNRFAYFRRKMAESKALEHNSKITRRIRRRRSRKLAANKKILHPNVPVKADLLILYADLDGTKNWRRIAVLAAAPIGMHDVALTAYSHAEKADRTYRLSRIKEMIDLETDRTVTNRFAFIRKTCPSEFITVAPSPVAPPTDAGETAIERR